LISVWDKTDIAKFAKKLTDMGIRITATFGTWKYLKEQGINVANIDQITGFSELLNGRVKTIHPKIFAGVLAQLSNKEHLEQLYKLGAEPIDMVVINFRSIEKSSDEKTLFDSIDIGGVALLRAAAKNYRDVVPVCDPEDYDEILKSIDTCGDVVLQHRRKLCAKAFLVCSKYDAKLFEILRELFAVDL